ncbi:DUF397 domain-containing protein [Streptomyces diacarni]|nr:DUF397 domain-containing protein [Streptomyces diacarni]
MADGYPGIVPVRDSKAPARTPLVYSAAAWTVFVNGLKRRVR